MDTNKKQEILYFGSVIFNQIYLLYEDKQYVGTKNWTCYGSLYLFRFSEIFLQFTEHTIIFHIQHILGYFLRTHDILIIYDSKIMDIKNVLGNLSIMCPTQKFTM